MMLTLAAGSTNVIQLSSLENRGVAVTDATVQVLGIKGNRANAINAADFPISMPYSGALSLYEGVLPDTLDLVVGRSYQITVKADDAGVIRQWVLRATVKGA